MPVKVGFISLGCPKNLVDSEVMMGYLTGQGWEITARQEEAEILVVNTCAFIGPAKEESIQTILEMAQMKQKGCCRKLIVAGCLAERYGQEVRAEIPEVDAVLGVHRLQDVLSLCREVGDDSSTEKRKKRLPAVPKRILATPGHYAYLKIAEGCGHTCSFCVIPRIRGPHRSRPLASLVREAEELAAGGVRELNLISQDTTAYGSDLGLLHGLAELLGRLARLPEIRRIRFLYAYPSTIDEAVLEMMAGEPKICRYLDLPLQHVDRRLLAAMGRGGTRRSLEKLIAGLRKKVPDLALRTAMIVGHPGESAEQFQELMDFCREMRFDHLGVFAYSEEEGTLSAAQSPKISQRAAESRRKRLMKQQEGISRQNNRRRIGQTVEVLLDGLSAESEWLYQARAAFQAPEIDGVVLINDSQAPNLQTGRFYQVRVTQALAHDLVGGVVDSSEAISAV